MPELLEETSPPEPPLALDALTEEEQQRQFRVQLVDVSHGVTANAVDRADRYISEQTSEHGFKGFIKRIWHGNIARDYIRQREVQRGRGAIVDSGNLYVNQGESREAHDAAMEAVVGRFTSDYDLLHQGEHNEDLAQDEPGRELESELKSLIRSYANNEISYEDLVEAKTTCLSLYGQKVRGTDRNRGLLYADNVVTVAHNAKQAVEHGVALEKIDELLGMRVGEARVGVRTEAQRTTTDRLVDKLYSTRGGSVINETTLAVSAGIVISASKFVTQKAATAAGAFIGMGVGAGVVAGVREHARVGQERRLHIRQMAEGETLEQHGISKRRDNMEATRYETVGVDELLGDLTSATEILQGDTPDGLRRALEQIALVQTRITLSDERSMDLIEFSSKASVEQERFELDLRLAEAKDALGHTLEASDDATLHAQGLSSRDVDTVVASELTAVTELLDEDITAKDAAFRALRRNRTLAMGAVGFVTSIGVGTAIQEIKAALNDQVQGVFEHPTAGDDRRTLLAGLLHRGSLHHVIPGQEGPDQTTIINDQTRLGVPPGYELIKGSGGQWELLSSNKQVVGDLTFDSSGHLSAASQELLQQKGFSFSDQLEGYDTVQNTSETVSTSVQQYMNAHPGQLTHVHRELWYANDTPGKYDLNELKLDWGGTHATGIDAHGNFVFNVAHMTNNGSFEHSASAHAQQLIHEGKMAIAISATKGSQSEVFMIPIDAQGNAVINANSFIAKSLFESQNGHAHFIGAYAEAVQINGTGTNGETLISPLATVVGANHPEASSQTINHVITTMHERVLTSLTAPKIETVTNLPTEVPFVLPIAGRRGLEDNKTDEPEGEETGYYGYNLSESARQRWERERSPSLRRDPNADLDTGRELAWYRDEQRRRRGNEYVDEIDSFIEADAVLEGVGAETKALVCIPVAAASEADNIYRTLSLYNQQSGEAKRATVIVLNVNWLESLESDPEKRASIDKTRAEIERAKTDFPDLRIASFERTWSAEFVQRRGGKIYGEVIKVLYDTAALAVDRSVREGRRSSNEEAILITNDADAQGLQQSYLDRYISSMDQSQSVDVFTGLIRWGTEEYREYPGYGVTSGVYALMNMLSQRAENRSSNATYSIGPNAAFRMSTYAAVGGCEDSNTTGAGADSILGMRILDARRPEQASSRAQSGYPNGAGYLSTSGRRAPRGIGRVLRRRGRDSVSDRDVVKHVTGAGVDTLADRLLGAYRQGQWIGSGWGGFDDGGYQDRRQVAALGTLGKEDVKNDIDNIAERIALNVRAMATTWFRDPALVTSALTLYFGSTDEHGEPLHTSKWESDGTFSFAFTPQGKKWLQNRLLRGAHGRFDPYGSRLRRQLYNETKPAARRQPVTATPRYVAPTA